MLNKSVTLNLLLSQVFDVLYGQFAFFDNLYLLFYFIFLAPV